MTEFRNIREALEELEAINNPRTEIGKVREEYDIGACEHNATIKDLQEINYDTITNICDQLGMSDIYMRGNKNETSKRRG